MHCLHLTTSLAVSMLGALWAVEPRAEGHRQQQLDFVAAQQETKLGGRTAMLEKGMLPMKVAPKEDPTAEPLPGCPAQCVECTGLQMPLCDGVQGKRPLESTWTYIKALNALTAVSESSHYRKAPLSLFYSGGKTQYTRG